MIGYLIYDSIDIERNAQFIQWFIDEGKEMDFEIILKTSEDCFSNAHPDFVINRSRKSAISLLFHQKNISVFNSYEVTHITNDKLKTFDHFSRHQIPMLETTIYSKPEVYPCVVKSRKGHGGTEVFLIQSEDDLKDTFDDTFIIQPLAPTLGKDLRVFVMNNQILDAVLRSNELDFKSNYSLGGHIELYKMNPCEIDLVKRILTIMPMDYAGIDFLFDEKGHLILNEIEDAVGARMLYNLTNHNIVSLYLSHIASRLKQH